MNNKHTSFWLTPTGWAALGLIAVASYFVLLEHQQHLIEYLPLLIIALCPLLHVFMHGSHGKHHQNKDSSLDKKEHKPVTSSADDNDAFKEGYLQGLKTAKKEQEHRESGDER